MASTKCPADLENFIDIIRPKYPTWKQSYSKKTRYRTEFIINTRSGGFIIFFFFNTIDKKRLEYTLVYKWVTSRSCPVEIREEKCDNGFILSAPLSVSIGINNNNTYTKIIKCSETA